jgi:hypothetical protein
MSGCKVRLLAGGSVVGEWPPWEPLAHGAGRTAHEQAIAQAIGLLRRAIVWHLLQLGMEMSLPHVTHGHAMSYAKSLDGGPKRITTS